LTDNQEYNCQTFGCQLVRPGSEPAEAVTPSAINKLDNAIARINDERSNIGAKQNRLEFTSSNLMNSTQNNSASMSTIRDADFAAEAADLAKNQILTQSGTAMLAQANSLSQNVLSLIR